MPLQAVTDDLLAMLEVRSSDGLPLWIASRLAAAYGGLAPRVMRVYPANAARVRGLSGYVAFAMGDPAQGQPPSPVELDPLLLDALRERRPLSLEADGPRTRALLTLHGGGETRYAIDLRGDGELQGDQQALGTMATFATRYFERLVDAETDPLTRLNNRRMFQSHIDWGLRVWATSGGEYHLAMMDIDHFKGINDEFGHLYGDEILVHFANLMRRCFRAGDLLYRFGGEEFVVVYRSRPPLAAEQVLERFRDTVEKHRFPGVRNVTISIGFTRIADGATPAALLIERADQAVYHAKGQGRNRVCSWEALAASGQLPHASLVNREATLF